MNPEPDDISNSEDNEIFFGCTLDAFRENDEALNLIANLANIYDDEAKFEICNQRFTYIFDTYQELPHLLNPHIQTFVDNLLVYSNTNTPVKLRHKAFQLLYILTKVRGYKCMLRYFPHEVNYLETILKLLEEQDCFDHDTWQTRYILLLWFSIIVIVPFHIKRIEGKVDEHHSFAKRISDLIENYLNVGDKARDAAAFLAAKFFTRPDILPDYLPDFLSWALGKLTNNSENTIKETNIKAGILLTLAQIFKYGKREEFRGHALEILPQLMTISTDQAGLVHKMYLKLIQRICLTLLPTRVATWRYNIGCRSLAVNISQPSHIPQQVVSQNGQGDAPMETQEEEDDFEDEVIAQKVLEILELLLMGLRAKDTIVRWSAAKGLGRISERLPKSCAADVVKYVLDFFKKRESDCAWHGACLTLAELGRRGLILPEQLTPVIKVVLKALFFDEVRGNFSVGSHIRDAACYVLWSFARSFEPTLMKPYVHDIAGGLLVASVFDREVNCRRAASASFQEHVGRQVSFPHGIDLLTKTDYQAVGSRANCYLKVCCKIAEYEEYTQLLIEHLVKYKVSHPDASLRSLTAQSLHKLTPFDPSFMMKQILPNLVDQFNNVDLYSRHGAILSIGEIVHALSLKGVSLPDTVGEDFFKLVVNILKVIEEKKMFQGMGGEIIRVAACSLIANFSRAALSIAPDTRDLWKKMIDACLLQTEESVRLAAVEAIEPFYTQYFPKSNPAHQEVLDNFISTLNTASRSEAVSGCLMGLGALPSYILAHNSKKVIQTIISHANLGKERVLWTEIRRDALKTLAKVTHSLGNLAMDHTTKICACLLASLDDYTQDSRGDVGSMVREAGIQSLVQITQIVMKLKPSVISKDISSRMFGGVLKQCVEKIDRTRDIAGLAFYTLLHCKPYIPHVPHREELEEACPESFCKHLNWSSPAHTFPILVPLLRLRTYTANLLLGIITSVGGLSESLVIHSRDSLFTYLASIQNDPPQAQYFYSTLLVVFKSSLTNKRIIIPFFKMMDHILTSSLIPVTPEIETNFLVQLTNLSWEASSKSKDPQRLIAVIDVFCSLLNYEGKIQKKALSSLVIFLCHRYPRIRKVTANKLYEAALMANFVKEENLDEVNALLSETNWDECVEYLRPIRNELCKLMDIRAPVPIKSS